MITIKPALLQYAKDIISEYNIDESHGIQHYINTTNYADTILNSYNGMEIIPGYNKNRELEIMLDAAFCHDLIDSKYIDEMLGIYRLKCILETWYSSEEIDIIINIISSISFSKRIRRKKLGLDMIAPGPLAHAIGIIVDADQLDGYDTERCRIFQESKFGYDPTNEKLCRGWRKTILVNRVLKYKDEYMNTDIAKKMAIPLHDAVIKHVADELADAEIFDYP